MIKKLPLYKQADSIQKKFTNRIYMRAKFVLNNTDDNVRIRKNLFLFYDADEIRNSARQIILNYEKPFFTFDKMLTMLSHQEEVIKSLKKAVPQWNRAVNTMFRNRKKFMTRTK